MSFFNGITRYRTVALSAGGTVTGQIVIPAASFTKKSIIMIEATSLDTGMTLEFYWELTTPNPTGIKQWIYSNDYGANTAFPAAIVPAGRNIIWNATAGLQCIVHIFEIE